MEKSRVQITDQPWWYACIVFLATLPMIGWWATGLFDLDEGFYGAVVAEMNRRGEWITPYYNGAPWFEKPILLYWLAKPSIGLLGMDWGPRLPSVICTVGLFLVCGWFAKRRLVAGSRELVVTALGSSLLVLVLGRLMMTDAPLNLALTVAMISFWESLVGDKRWRILTAAMLGVGVLAKGPVAILLFLPIIGWTYNREPHLRPQFRGQWIAGSVVLFAVIATWYLPAYLASGQEFVQKFLVDQNLKRFTGGDAAHTLGIASMPAYIPIIFLGMFPWSWFIWKAWPRRRLNANRPGEDLRRYLATWAAVIFIFFSISGAKLPHYVLPVFAPLALLVADYIKSERPQKGWISPWLPVGLAAGFTVLLNVAASVWYKQSGQAEAHSIIRSIPKEAKVALYQLSRRNEARATGTTKLQETSLPSLIMYLDRPAVDTELEVDALSGTDFIFCRRRQSSMDVFGVQHKLPVERETANYILYRNLK